MANLKRKVAEILSPVFVIGLTAASFVLAYFLKKYLLPETLRGLSIAPNYYIMLLMVVIVWYLVFQIYGWVLPENRQKLLKSVTVAFKGVTAGMLIVLVLMYLFKMTDVSRIMMGIFYCLNILVLWLYQLGSFFYINRIARNGNGVKNLLIIGSRQRARDVLERIGSDRWNSYRVLGCLEVDESQVGQAVNEEVRVVGHVSELKSFLLSKVVDEIVIAMPLKLIINAEEYLALAEDVGVGVRIMPDWQIYRIRYRPRVATALFEPLNDTPTLLLTTVVRRDPEYLCKVAFDYGFAALALIVLSPLFLMIAVAVKLASPGGPVFFRQERCGMNGRRFTMYKFRTMAPDAEERLKALLDQNETDGPAFKIRRDPRIIPYVGTFLRKSQLDELPQLINVIRGDMSLIGPRPLMPWVVDSFDIWQRRRMSMKPGLTCLWQIAEGRNDLPFEDWMRLDLDYIDKWSLEKDLKIFARTFKAVMIGSGR